MLARLFITLAMCSVIATCMQEFNTPFSAGTLLSWANQMTSSLTSNCSLTMNIINNSPWQLDFPKVLHASGGVMALPSGLKPSDTDTFVSVGNSTEGLLSFPINGDYRHLTIYWKVPQTNNSQENTIGVYYGTDLVNATLLQKISGNLTGFQPVKSKDTWFTYFLDQQFTVQVMMSDQASALSAVHISYGYQSLPVSGSTYKIAPLYALTKRLEFNGKLQQVFDNTFPGQRWIITKIENNFYKIVNLPLSCALTIANQFVVTCIPYNPDNINQAWEIIRLNQEDYMIKGAGSTLYLDNNYSTVDYSAIILYESYDSITQKFKIFIN
jgi:hypothetical protein